MKTIPTLDSRGLLRWIERCNQYQARDYVPFLVAGQRVGAVHRSHLPRVAEHPEVFQLAEEALSLRAELATPAERTQAVDAVLRQWHEQGLFSGWRDEPYRVSVDFHGEPLLEIERAASAWFGVQKYGIHLNGVSRRDGERKMWIGRRARDSYTFPGKLDQLVAGGLGAAYSARETLLKECAEEAAIPETLAAQAKPAGLVSYVTEREQCLVRDVLFIYDLELPEDFLPLNADREMETFYLWRIPEVAARVAETDDFKDNCNLVIIDFLLRHGYLTPDQADYQALAQGLRQGI